MWLAKMAWKNIWRNKHRSVITMSAIFFAVILSVLASSLKDGIFDNLVKNVVSFYTGYIQVHKNGYWNEQILDNAFKASGKVEKQLLQQPNVQSITARLESFALISSGDITRGAMVVGIEPDKESAITLLKQKLISGNYLQNSDQSILIAKGLSDRLHLTINDTIVLIGQGYQGTTAAGKYLIKGIVQFGSPDLNDKMVYMPLLAAQDLYSAKNMVTSYVLSLQNKNNVLNTVTDLRKQLGIGYEVMSWSELIPEIKQHIESDSRSMNAVQVILYILICFGIFSTLLMMMVERKYEMGLLIAIGMKKAKLIYLLIIELLVTVIAGCLLGLIVSTPLIYYLSIHPLTIKGDTAKAYEKFGFEAIFPTSVDPHNFINQGLMVVFFGLLMCIYPIYAIIRLNPLQAMKR